MMSLRKTVLSATIAMMLGPAGFAWAAGPTETVQTAIQRVFTESSAPQARAGSTDDRRAHIREAAESLFDFREMARRSLGERFDALSAADQKEFVRLFTNLIAASYLGKIEAYAGERNIDLLVMGAFGHSKLREFILGGATRRMLTRPFTWTLLSH